MSKLKDNLLIYFIIIMTVLSTTLCIICISLSNQTYSAKECGIEIAKHEIVSDNDLSNVYWLDIKHTETLEDGTDVYLFTCIADVISSVDTRETKRMHYCFEVTLNCRNNNVNVNTTMVHCTQ